MAYRMGKIIRSLSLLIRKKIDSSETFRNNPDLTTMQGWTMGYLYTNILNGKDVFQKDVEDEFKICRSTATGMLQAMEQKGYLYREASESDGRLKRIILSENAILLQKQVIKTLTDVENKILDGFSEKETNELLAYLLRIKNNLERND